MSDKPSSTRQRQPIVAEIPLDELRVRLRSIVASEQASCQLLQLELLAAIQGINTSSTIRRRAESILTALAAADNAYGKLLAELDRPAAR